MPAAYDVTGRRVWRPSKKRYAPLSPNVAMGRHMTGELAVRCSDLEDLRRFLLSCVYVPDQVQFGRADHWMPPEEFERRRMGDCDDFALWTWRALLGLGFDARLVCGTRGIYGAAHAWVTFLRDGRHYLVEPQRARLGSRFPRLLTLGYRPRVSVAWAGERLKYFEHEQRPLSLRVRDVLLLLPEWAAYWIRTRPLVWHARVTRWLRLAVLLGRWPGRRSRATASGA